MAAFKIRNSCIIIESPGVIYKSCICKLMNLYWNKNIKTDTKKLHVRQLEKCRKRVYKGCQFFFNIPKNI